MGGGYEDEGYGDGEFDLDGYLSAEMDENGLVIGFDRAAVPGEAVSYPADPRMIAEQRAEAERYPGPSTTGYAQEMAGRLAGENPDAASGWTTIGGVPVDFGVVDIPADQDLGIEGGD